MTTKEINVETKRTVYVAFDGKEFDEKYKCEDYENGFKIEKCCSTIEFLEGKNRSYYGGIVPPDGEYHNTDNKFYWFRPKNIEEINLLNETFGQGEELFFESDIHNWVCVESAYDDDFWCSRFDWCVEYVERFFKTFGYDVTFKFIHD